MEEGNVLSVNIVTWNSFQYLTGLCASLDAQGWSGFTLTVVDNASNDGTVKWLQESRPGTTVLRNFHNQGLARAHNQAIALALSRWTSEDLAHRYILLGDPSIEFAPDCLQELVAAMESDASLVACGPKLLRSVAQPGTLDHAWDTERTDTIESTGVQLSSLRIPHERGAGEVDNGQYDTQTEVFGFSSCVVVRASVLQQCKTKEDHWMDERLPDACILIDLARRLRMRGPVRLIPLARAWMPRKTETRAWLTGLRSAVRNWIA